MNVKCLQSGDSAVIERQHLERLFETLTSHGYEVIGPTIRDGAIVYDCLSSADELPVGWTDEQSRGTYRLKRRDDDAVFGYTGGPCSWKKFLHPPVQRLWSAKRNGAGFQIQNANGEAPWRAFIGVRACELRAIAIQDKVFMDGHFVDPVYKSRRENLFIVAVNCGSAGGNCFCASMNAGPKATDGFDLALTEVLEKDQHWFFVEIGTEHGAQVLAEIPHRLADESDMDLAGQVVAQTARIMGRAMDTTGIKELLYRNSEHPRWDHVAARCLTCANCTMVCPTCFCTTVEDVTDLTGQNAERWRKWDSCFTMDCSYIHGGSVRATPKSRYRQWLTHKLATWEDQFGTLGCVGCGRCIIWCPAGIDITEEVRAIRETDSRGTVQKGAT